MSTASIATLSAKPQKQQPHLTIVAHTHWDREWYEPFEAFRLRLLEVIDEALDLLERDPRLSFTLDGQMALVDDYLELREESAPRIRALVEQGRLHIGPWYTQADTLLVEGEAVIRNLATGMARAAQLGGAMHLGYLPDQFGHAAQLPQIFRLFGIERAVLWRGIGPERPPHAFRWVGPDGSSLGAWWLQDGYATGRLLPSDPRGFAEAVERMLDRLGPWLGETPLLLPVGDDHVRLASWLGDAVAHLQARRPEAAIVVGGFHHHPPAGPTPHIVAGELRSPAFAPVLAGVASARIREKQASARATAMLVRYVEPLTAWAASVQGSVPSRELARAWRHLILNHAHDSAAGCGSDETHEDVRARYRWSEQLGQGLRDQLLGRLAILGPDGTPATRAVFNPGPAAASVIVETDLPASAGSGLVVAGPDGVRRPVQVLESGDGAAAAPLFEGEFGPDEIAVFVQGLDPATPLFGLYLVAIQARFESPGKLRLDVTLGPEPVDAATLGHDQRHAAELLPGAGRIHVIVHRADATQRALLEVGPVPEAGFLPLVVEPAPAPENSALAPVVALVSAGATAHTDDDTIALGGLRVTALPDGTVRIGRDDVPLDPLIGHLIVDEGDRGDLYHFDPAGEPTATQKVRWRVLERGPLQARLRLEQELEVPAKLSEDRRSRSSEMVRMNVTTDVRIRRDSPRVEFTTTLDNVARDHRMRVLFRLPFAADRLDVDHGLAVIDRPLDPSVLGGGVERPARTGPHHLFVDASDGFRGVALMARGLPEHELIVEPEGCTLALTLLRSVGWLARGDLSCIDHAVGPMLETPGAQEAGAHRFEYAVLLHAGTWEGGNVMAEARRYAAPPVAFVPRGPLAVPAGQSLVHLEPASLVLSAAYAAPEGGTVIRLLNAAQHPVVASLRPAFPTRQAVRIDPLHQPLADARPIETDRADHGGSFRLSMNAWELVTLLMR
jgi:alpha-mannosidase